MPPLRNGAGLSSPACISTQEISSKRKRTRSSAIRPMMHAGGGISERLIRVDLFAPSRIHSFELSVPRDRDKQRACSIQRPGFARGNVDIRCFRDAVWQCLWTYKRHHRRTVKPGKRTLPSRSSRDRQHFVARKVERSVSLVGWS